MEFDLLEFPLRKWILAHTKLSSSIYGEDEKKINEKDSHHIYSNYDEESGKIVQELEFWFDIIETGSVHKTNLYGLEKDPMLTNMLGKIIASIPMVYSSIVKTLTDEICETHKLKKIGFVTDVNTIVIGHIEGEQLPIKIGIFTKNTRFGRGDQKKKVRDPLADAWKKIGIF